MLFSSKAENINHCFIFSGLLYYYIIYNEQGKILSYIRVCYVLAVLKVISKSENKRKYKRNTII